MLRMNEDDGAEFFNRLKGTPNNNVSTLWSSSNGLFYFQLTTTLMETGLDDSLLEAFKTPELKNIGVTKRKAFIPDIVNRESGMIALEPRQSIEGWAMDSAER